VLSGVRRLMHMRRLRTRVPGAGSGKAAQRQKKRYKHRKNRQNVSHRKLTLRLAEILTTG
jgi:hypothetical protein